MEKKTFIISAAVTAVIVAGALFVIRSTSLSDDADKYSLMNGLLAQNVSVGGVDYLVPPEDIYSLGEGIEIPALTNPTFTTVAAMDRLLGDELYGIDVEINGVHRFYPEQVMNWHQVVNHRPAENTEDPWLVIVHDPLSGTSVVYEDPGGLESGFSASGKVYNNTLLMNDGEGSLWLASRGVAVVGEAAGSELRQFPSETMSWQVWKALHPDGEVLSAEATGYVRDYTRHPYGDYEATPSVYFPLNSTDARLNPKTTVTGIDINGEQLAISRQLLETLRVVNDTVGGVPLVAMHDIETGKTGIGTTRVFSPVVGEQVLTFTYDGEKERFIDAQTGGEWTADGHCQKGTLRGTQLLGINAPEYYWFAWAAVFPDTRVNPTLADVAAAKNE